MASKKEFSKSCTKCGVEWNDDFSNKYPKRALCYPCHKVEYKAIKEKYNKKHNGLTKNDLLQPYKIQNRTAVWKEVNKQLKPLKKLEDIHKFIVQQADKVFADDNLMAYINKEK